jgi:hypothetical protein
MKPHKFQSALGRALPAIVLLVLTLGRSQTAFAQDVAVNGDKSCGCWIDTKTGKPTTSRPQIDGQVIIPDYGDPTRAFDPVTGRNFFLDRKDCLWKDAKTGKPLNSRPQIDGRVIIPDYGDPTRAFDPVTGRNFARVPCPPPSVTTAPPPRLDYAVVPARYEFAVGYTHMATDGEEVGQLNGFNASGFYNVKPWLAVGGEFSGLYGCRTNSFFGVREDVSLDRYLYLFGVRASCPIG